MRFRVIVVAAVVARTAVMVAAPLRVTIDGSSAEGCRSGVVVATPLCAMPRCEGEVRAPWRLGEDGRAAVVIDAPATERWNVAVQAERCWAPEVRAGLRNGEPPIAVRLWRSAVVTGRLRFPEEAKSPPSVPVRIESARDAVPATIVQCPVAGERFRCIVPAAVLDLRIGPEDWAAQYLWGVESRPGVSVDVGVVKFEEGGTIAGFVELTGYGPPLPAVSIELAPALPTPTSSVEEGKRRMVGRTQTVHPSARGFFQFRQLEPGSYTITARMKGWSAARAADVRVEDGRETAIESSLMIEPLARVEVFVLPPLDPRGEPWKITLLELMPLNEGTIPIAEGAASLTGQWSAEGVDAAMHLVKVSDQRGNDFLRSVVEVAPGMAPLQLSVTAIAVEGTVRVGEDPLQASLLFRHVEGRQVRLRTDAEGRFSGTLPGEGRWQVELVTEAQHRLNRTVEVQRRDGAPSRVDFALPDTAIDVSVVSESGKPVKAYVRALDEQGLSVTSALTDDEGRLRLRGLDPEAQLRLSATAGSEGMQSGAVPVTFDSDGQADLTLIMKSQVKVKGWLLTPAGRPVAGAFVRWFLPYGNRYVERVSGPSGEFEIALPHDAGALDLIILPPAMPVKLLTVPIHADMDRNLEIVVGGPAGTLELTTSHEPPFPAIRRDGRPVSAGSLRYPLNWTAAPQEWRPWGLSLRLEAGNYSVCSNTGANCKALSLAPGAVERIDGRALLQ